MKTLKSVLYVSLLFVISSIPRSESFAQRNALPAGLNQNSTIKEILGYLNENSFPYAHIGLDTALPGSDSWDAEAGYDSPIVSAVFSQGFKLVSEADDCHITLRNDDVKFYDADDKNLRPIDLSKLMDTQPPYAVEFSTWLETVSYDKGKATFFHTRKPEKAKLLGAWRTEFISRGFYGRSIFGMRFPAIKREAGNEFLTSSNVTFTFDDRQASERFNAAFRRLIKLCQPRSTKPRWNG
jgi:hypothetical protein